LSGCPLYVSALISKIFRVPTDLERNRVLRYYRTKVCHAILALSRSQVGEEMVLKGFNMKVQENPDQKS
jgi:hypothetical protein